MKLQLFTFLIFCSLTMFAQDYMHCGTDKAMEQLYKKKIGLKEKKAQHDKEFYKSKQGGTPLQNTFVIPVVFHILHLNGPENISDAQVKDGLRILNRDFSLQNADTSEIIQEFKQIADSVDIQFILATKDPMGNCTNGIIHHYDTDTDWDVSSPTTYQHTWNSTQYMNVYIVRSINLGNGFGAAGFTYLPGSWNAGAPEDAIVLLNNYFASIGTGNNFLSRVLTHEVGHWLNLWHVFGSSNSAGVECFEDDGVSDTPLSIGYRFCPDVNNPSFYQTCTPGVSENFQNYMDYSYCCRMFTQGQAERMELAMQDDISGRANLWTNSNLFYTGVFTANQVCVPTANFYSNRKVTCVNTPISFFDNSYNAVPTSHNWTFAGGNPSTSTLANPVVSYALPGNYTVTYSCGSSAGNSPTITLNNYVTVNNGTAQVNGTYNFSYENSDFLTQNWTLENSSGGINWEESPDAAFIGFWSAKLNSVSNTRMSVTSMISPSINLSLLNQPKLNFAVATAEVDLSHVNNLKVFISTDCQNTWTQVYSKTGSSLISSVSTAEPFIPLSSSEWRVEEINLNNFSNAAAANFKFQYTRDTIRGASNIFIDNVAISSTNGVNELNTKKYTLYPNPASNFLNCANCNDIKNLVITQADGKEVLISNTFPVEINSLSKGVYFIKLYNKIGNSFQQKFVKIE
jgi:hypothetical protein